MNKPSQALGFWATSALVPCGVAILLAKLVFAARLDLYSDEVYYWLESTRPALAYSDLPFMSALLAGLGSALLETSPLATRAPFLILGSTIPLLLYWLAHPLVGRTRARESALLCLCLPLAASMGLLAVPDVPLLFLALLSLGLFLRALESDSVWLWTATGIAIALGLCTHYRFALFPGAVLLLMLFDARFRRLWRNPRAWLAGVLALVGLAPVTLFNLNHGMVSAEFYFLDRHAWEFSATGLLQPAIQALISTPPLYALLLLTLFSLWRRADAAPRLIALIGTLHIGVFALLAPWSDPTSTTIHWPLPGYVPLLVYAPSLLSELRERRPSLSYAPRLVLFTGLIGTASALLGVGSQSLHPQLQPLLGRQTLSTKMAAWPEFAEVTQDLIERSFRSPPLLVSDNYYTAAQIAFQNVASSGRIYTLDSEKAVRDGRAYQLALWRMDQRALTTQEGRQALLITEDSTLNYGQKNTVLGRACSLSSELHYLGSEALLGGAKRYSFYRLEIGGKSERCAMPALGWIDSPKSGQRVESELSVTGWAFAADSGLAAIEVLIDERPMPAATARGIREDVRAIEGATADPDFPSLGFSRRVDLRGLEPGIHTLRLRLVNREGEETLSEALRFVLAPGVSQPNAGPAAR